LIDGQMGRHPRRDQIGLRCDADGRRVELRTRPNGGAETTVTFRYQGEAIAQELTGTTPVLARTYLTDEAGAIVKVCDPDCTGTNPQYLVTWNGHGDALALWRIETSGALTLANSYTYTTFGQPTTTTHNGYADLALRYLYVGRAGVAWDGALGLELAHMGARHYSPSLGRFVQPDPSALETNLYAYAENSPVTKVDPSGESACMVVVLLGPQAVAVSCGAVMVVSGIAFGVSWLATHPIQLPRINVCLWNCPGASTPAKSRPYKGDRWWEPQHQDPRLADWARFLARYKYADTISPRPPIRPPSWCFKNVRRRAACTAIAVTFGLIVTSYYIYPPKQRHR
jgi:RHS repeat-associated protein